MAASEYTHLVNTNNGEQIPYTSVNHGISQQVGRAITTKTGYIREGSRHVLQGDSLSLQNRTERDCRLTTREHDIYWHAPQKCEYRNVYRNTILSCP